MSAGTRQKILFVDDEESWRNQVSACLVQAGFDVLAAADGSEAMHKAAESPLGLIIVDDDLAGESGVMLTKFLRCNHPGVPTMLYTTRRRSTYRPSEMTSDVADRCLPKGSMTDLLANVAYYVR
jgi:two-component system OmpR family response regulator